MTTEKTTREGCKAWLGTGYTDLLADIDYLEAKWEAEGRKTRRAWWRVLAGTKAGKPCVVDGVTFPIIRAARERLGLPPVPHAIERKPGEVAPAIRETGRWAKERLDVPTEEQWAAMSPDERVAVVRKITGGMVDGFRAAAVASARLAARFVDVPGVGASNDTRAGE